jgi:energy-coupling factor transporter ATP-binding protein EcfA2
VLEGASLEVDEGQFVSLVGPSGSGKSSLLRAVIGLQLPVAGSVDPGVAGSPAAPARRVSAETPAYTWCARSRDSRPGTADAQGDVDAFIQQYDEQTRKIPKIAAEIARRLLSAGRAVLGRALATARGHG